jgi:hypothetical protein
MGPGSPARAGMLERRIASMRRAGEDSSRLDAGIVHGILRFAGGHLGAPLT